MSPPIKELVTGQSRALVEQAEAYSRRESGRGIVPVPSTGSAACWTSPAANAPETRAPTVFCRRRRKSVIRLAASVFRLPAGRVACG